MTTSIETQRQRILDVNLYDSEVISFDAGTIYWIPAAEEWMLLDITDGVKDYTFGSLEELLELIPDADIEACYEDIAWQFEDEDELESAE
jgi:hypothetical protein